MSGSNKNVLELNITRIGSYTFLVLGARMAATYRTCPPTRQRALAARDCARGTDCDLWSAASDGFAAAAAAAWHAI